MELSSIRALTDEELTKQALQAGEGIFRIRFQKSMGNLEGLGKLKAYKTEIARVKTIQRERVLSVAGSGSPEKAVGSGPSQRNARKKARKA